VFTKHHPWGRLDRLRNTMKSPLSK